MPSVGVALWRGYHGGQPGYRHHADATASEDAATVRKVTSREYKLMLDHGRFARRKKAAAELLREIEDFVKPQGIKTKGTFDSIASRTILFLDTEDFTLRNSGVVLRRRVEDNGQHQYTLKCRTPDRYLADGVDVGEASGLNGDDKFEEDIGLPFVSRFSHSNTIEFKSGDEPKKPKTLGKAGRLFPWLRTLRHDGRRCDAKSKIVAVNSVRAFEQVFTGPRFILDSDSKTGRAEIALILWSNQSNGRVLLAEFSFRYKNKHEEFPVPVARAAKDLFELLAHLDSAQPGAMTKTEYVYRTAGPAIA
jgi:hypothetical protein